MGPQAVRRTAYALLATALVACSSGGPGLKRPGFPDPRAGVWNSPVAVVESTEDDMMPDVSSSGWLVYSSKTNGNVDIYRRAFNGGSPERLTDHSSEDTDPAISPNGEKIAFSSQSADVKGDIWVMDVDGGGKRKLTDRATSDSAPCWSPSGKAVYFTSAVLGSRERIERIDLEYGNRTVVVEDAWDASISPDGKIVFYAALDDDLKTRVFAKRLSDNAVAAVTDGAYPEAFPRVRPGSSTGTVELLLVRFADDRTRDATLDGNDSASIWSTRFDPALFEGGEPSTPIPLTSGSGSELFVSSVGDWIVYTTSGFGDLEVYALPEEGVVSRRASHEAILEAARSEDDPSLRRLGLRTLIVTAPELAGPAHYLLARDLAERGLYAEATTSLGRAAEAFGEDPMAIVS
ncbi:MAG: hypothetical protein AAF658_10210, partial [Myxococcota bacterium]